MSPSHLKLFLVALFASCTVAAKQPEVELNYRIQPGRDLTTETVVDAVTTIRVLEDRGIVAKSSGRISSRPVSIRLTNKQTIRYITGQVQPDQTFPVEMHYIDKTSHVIGLDGQRQLLPERMPFKGLRVVAAVELGGKLREDSVEVMGGDPAIAEPLRKIIAAVLTQAAAVQPIALSVDQSVPQVMALQVPLPGLPPLDIKMRISNQLLSVDDGIARVQQIYSMDFINPAGAMKMTAEGSGGGTMLYEVSTQTLLSTETGTLMKMTIETAEGVIEIQANSKESQTTRPTNAAAR
ncbi:hypothetical protein [Ideonella sp.]|jgi:hypothetical protein|uniref:hypothetical protein n=1 Tax=Ideonella sp. TaxID=1929293 RepID=UPI0037BE7AA2